MHKIPLRELEEARRNPGAYRAKMQKSVKGGGAPMRWGYHNALREAIRQFHKMDDSSSAGYEYLEENLGRFKIKQRCIDTINQFSWYIDNYHHHGVITTQTYVNIQLPLEEFKFPIRCTGQVSRLDLDPAGGYIAWIFRSQQPHGWKQELRMPIIQDVTSKLLGVPSSEMKVGIISFREKFTELCVFDEVQIDFSFDELRKLIESLFTDS